MHLRYAKQYYIVSKGSLTGSLAHPREVFQAAIYQEEGRTECEVARRRFF